MGLKDFRDAFNVIIRQEPLVNEYRTAAYKLRVAIQVEKDKSKASLLTHAYNKITEEDIMSLHQYGRFLGLISGEEGFNPHKPFRHKQLRLKIKQLNQVRKDFGLDEHTR